MLAKNVNDNADCLDVRDGGVSGDTHAGFAGAIPSRLGPTEGVVTADLVTSHKTPWALACRTGPTVERHPGLPCQMPAQIPAHFQV